MDTLRTAVLRLGGLLGAVLLVGAGYNALRTPSDPCPASTSTKGYACDAQAPMHPHLELAVVLLVAAIAVFAAVAAISHVWTASILWKPPSERGIRGVRQRLSTSLRHTR